MLFGEAWPLSIGSAKRAAPIRATDTACASLVERDAATLLYRHGVAVRTIDILVLHQRRIERVWDGRRELRRFSMGVVATSVLWVAYPSCFFSRLTEFGQTATVMVLCGMASGGVTVLAASRRLAFFYVALTVLPTATLFLLNPGFEHRSDSAY
jgi:hypothetical protein